MSKLLKNKAFHGILAICLCLITVTYFVDTFAKYTATGTANGTISIAKWEVKAGNFLDTSASTTSGTITFAKLTSNDNVDSDKIAPEDDFYSDIVIDPKGADVAMDYSLSIGEFTNAPTGFAIQSVQYQDGTNTFSSGSDCSGTGPYTGSISLTQVQAVTDAEKCTVLRITAKWVDDQSSDAAHTTAGIAAATITVPVTLTITQKTS